MRTRYYIIFALLLLTNCKERYEPFVPALQTAFLVVEGFINADGQTRISLGRTMLTSDSGRIHEAGAAVFIEAENGNIMPLYQEGEGEYVSAFHDLAGDTRYRLRIQTSENKTYLSTYQQPVRTPAIDSISFTRRNGGVEIYVNSFDRENNTKYYRWEYDEDWEIRSKYESYVDYYLNRTVSPPQFVPYLHDPVNRTRNEEMYTCWNSRNSSSIKIGNTLRLAEDRVYVPLVTYPQGAEELSVLYSVNIRQYGLSREGYDFYAKMRKNTETLGSIFDAQPSEIIGNITCSENPEEIIIGHIDVTTVSEQRRFIYNRELPAWNYNPGCEAELYINAMNNDSLLSYIHYANRYPTRYALARGGGFAFLFAAKKECVDCRLRGGNNNKPAFWPY